jgi:basic membrane protein A
MASNHNAMKRFLCFQIMALVVALSLFQTGCGKKEWKPGMPLPVEQLKVGVIYISDPTTETSGYSFAHEQGILAMGRELALGEDQIIRKINIFENEPVLIESAMRDCIAAGARIIFATSWGYMDACEKLAAEFPNVVFAHCSGYKRNDANFTNYFGRIYQARYLSGLAAGLKTRTGKIGYVAAMGKDSSEVTGGVNAFALGVERVNPSARIYVRVTYSWYDPMGETDAARSLIASGCDVIAQHCDSPNPQAEAEKEGVWGIGYNSNMESEAPDAVLTSVLWNWGICYTTLARSVCNGTFTTAPYFGGLAEGMVGLAPFNTALVPPETAAVVEAERQRIVEGSFNIFDGLMQTNDGQVAGREEETLSDSEISSGINWYYRNIVE